MVENVLKQGLEGLVLKDLTVSILIKYFFLSLISFLIWYKNQLFKH